MVTESWLRSTIPDSAVNIGSNFASYRRDRPTSGGDLLAYVHKSIPTTRLQNLEEPDKEVILFQLKLARTPRPFRNPKVRVQIPLEPTNFVGDCSVRLKTKDFII